MLHLLRNRTVEKVLTKSFIILIISGQTFSRISDLGWCARVVGIHIVALLYIVMIFLNEINWRMLVYNVLWNCTEEINVFPHSLIASGNITCLQSDWIYRHFHIMNSTHSVSIIEKYLHSDETDKYSAQSIILWTFLKELSAFEIEKNF